MGKARKGPGQVAMDSVRNASGDVLKSVDYSGEVTATGQLIAEPCVLDGILIATDGTNDVTVQLHDGLSATGVKLAPAIVIPAADRLGGFASLGVRASVGVWAVITSVGTASVIGYYNS